MSYTFEIVAGCIAGSLLAGALSWFEHRVAADADRQAATVHVQVLARLAKSAHRSGAPIPLQRDPWETPYEIRRVGDSFRVCSLGPDRKPEGGDDICNTPPGIE